MYRRKNTNNSVFYCLFSLYLIVSPTELFGLAQFLKSNCAHRCIELFRISLAVVFRKHPGSAVSLRGEFKTSWCLELLIFTTSLTESIL